MKQADWYEYTSVIAPRPERTPPGTVTPCSKSVKSSILDTQKHTTIRCADEVQLA